MAIKNKKHLVFINEYIKTWNRTDAYARAYPKCSRETARRNGSVLLTNTDISEEIQRRIAEKAMQADEVLSRLGEHARGEYSGYLQPNGTLNLVDLLADGKGHLVHKIKPTRYGLSIEFYDAQAALVHIGRHLGLFKDIHEHSGLNGEPIQITTIEAVKPAGQPEEVDSDKG